MSQTDWSKAKQKTEEEMKITNPEIAFELKNNSGLIFGKVGNQAIAKPEEKDGHVLVVGGVGSGKTSCIAIPSLLSWKYTIFAIDIKGELYKKTNGKGERKQENILVLDPLDHNALGYNPFHFLDFNDNKAQEARVIANALIPMPPEVKEPFWIESARNLLTGAILHFYYEGFTFIDTIRKILGTDIYKLIEEISTSNTEKVIYFVSCFIGMAPETLYGIFAELSRHIVLFVTDEDIENCLEKGDVDDISPEYLETGFDIYIKIPEYRLEEWKNLLSLIVTQFLTYFEKRKEKNFESPNKDDPKPILFLLDEFARLGKMDRITNALATLRSKQITICIILQSLAQLDFIYGQATRRIICDICSYKAILSASDPDTQEVFSKLVGTYDRFITTDTKGYYIANIPQFGSGISGSIQERKIIKPEEFATLQDVVLLTPFKSEYSQSGFYRIERKPYYEDSSPYLRMPKKK